MTARKIRLQKVPSEWLRVLITLYSKEAINTGTLKPVFLRESTFFEKRVYHSLQCCQKQPSKGTKEIGRNLFFATPIYHRSIMTGSCKNCNVKFCLILPQSFWEKGIIFLGKWKKKLFDCHNLITGWFLWGMVNLTFAKMGAYCYFLFEGHLCGQRITYLLYSKST